MPIEPLSAIQTKEVLDDPGLDYEEKRALLESMDHRDEAAKAEAKLRTAGVAEYEVWEDRTREPHRRYRVDRGITFPRGWIKISNAPCQPRDWALGRILGIAKVQSRVSSIQTEPSATHWLDKAKAEGGPYSTPKLINGEFGSLAASERCARLKQNHAAVIGGLRDALDQEDWAAVGLRSMRLREIEAELRGLRA